MTWNDITVEQYSKLHPTLDISEMTDLELVDNAILQMSIVKGISLEDASYTLQSEVREIHAFLKTPLPTKIHRFWKCNGVRY